HTAAEFAPGDPEAGDQNVRSNLPDQGHRVAPWRSKNYRRPTRQSHEGPQYVAIANWRSRAPPARIAAVPRTLRAPSFESTLLGESASRPHYCRVCGVAPTTPHPFHLCQGGPQGSSSPSRARFLYPLPSGRGLAKGNKSNLP